MKGLNACGLIFTIQYLNVLFIHSSCSEKTIILSSDTKLININYEIGEYFSKAENRRNILSG